MIGAVARELRAQIEGLVVWLPGGLGFWARRVFFRRRFKALGSMPVLGASVLIRGPENIEIGDRFSCWRLCTLAACEDGAIVIGDRVSLNANVYINACSSGRIEVGHDVIVGPNTVMRASDHLMSTEGRPRGHVGGTIVIEDDVWIAANVTLVGGIRVGRGAVVAAGAVVTRDVEPYTIVGGVPARFIKMRYESPAAAPSHGATVAP